MTLNIQQFVNKCRCCLGVNEQSLEIDETIENKFFALMNYKLNSSPKLSNSICHICNKRLDIFSAFKKDVLANQTKLWVLKIEDDKRDKTSTAEIIAPCQDSPKVKIEPESDEHEDEDYQYFHKYYVDCSVPVLDPVFDDSLGDAIVKEEPEDRKDFDSKPHIQAMPSENLEASTLCQHCGKEVKLIHYDDHVDVHIRKLNNAPLQCDHCDYKTFVKFCMEEHLVVHKTNMKSYNCGICSKIFRYKLKRNKHEIEHYFREGKYCCPKCPKAFETIKSFRMHQHTVHPDKIFPCKFCDKIYDKRMSRNIHMESHGEKMPCQICGLLIFAGSRYNSHMKYHENGPFKCTVEGCGKEYEAKNTLQWHLKKCHGDSVTMRCKFCEVVYHNFDSARGHLRKKHKVKASRDNMSEFFVTEDPENV